MDLATEAIEQLPTGNGSGSGAAMGAGRLGTVTSTRQAAFTVPGLTGADGSQVAALLQSRLTSLVDLTLTLKHVHWNVVGPNFIAVHELLDAHHAGVQQLVDDLAERIATLGGVPIGLPGHIVETRTWDDYGLDRADSISHLGALDLVYQGVIGGHRHAIGAIRELDPITEDLLIGQTGVLEKYHWIVRSHLADWAGGMSNAGARSEIDAARAVAAKSSRNATRSGDNQ